MLTLIVIRMYKNVLPYFFPLYTLNIRDTKQTRRKPLQIYLLFGILMLKFEHIFTRHCV